MKMKFRYLEKEETYAKKKNKKLQINRNAKNQIQIEFPSNNAKFGRSQ